MIAGALIGESMRSGAELEAVPLAVRKIARMPYGDIAAGQPELWTVIEFEADERDAGALADGLATVLKKEGGWYADFRSPEESFVVFADRVFRYPRGDSAGRAEAAEYGRSAGVPEAQLDWTA